MATSSSRVSADVHGVGRDGRRAIFQTDRPPPWIEKAGATWDKVSPPRVCDRVNLAAPMTNCPTSASVRLSAARDRPLGQPPGRPPPVVVQWPSDPRASSNGAAVGEKSPTLSELGVDRNFCLPRRGGELLCMPFEIRTVFYVLSATDTALPKSVIQQITYLHLIQLGCHHIKTRI